MLAEALAGHRPIIEVLSREAAASTMIHRVRNRGQGAAYKVYNTVAENGRRNRSGRDRVLQGGTGGYRRGRKGAKRKDNLRCDIDVLDAEDFEGDEDAILNIIRERYYSRSRPVILRNGVKHWAGRRMLSKKRIVSEFGDIVASTSETPHVSKERQPLIRQSLHASGSSRDTAAQKMKSCLTVSTTRHSSRRLTS